MATLQKLEQVLTLAESGPLLHEPLVSCSPLQATSAGSRPLTSISAFSRSRTSLVSFSAHRLDEVRDLGVFSAVAWSQHRGDVVVGEEVRSSSSTFRSSALIRPSVVNTSPKVQAPLAVAS